MRITHEADYAIRIVYVLKKHGGLITAREISEQSGVTQRFALKILRKLASENILASQKGVTGGYKLSVPPEELSLGRIIESIDGPFEISHCLSDDFSCTRVAAKEMCQFRRIFESASEKLRDEFYSITMDQFN